MRSFVEQLKVLSLLLELASKRHHRHRIEGANQQLIEIHCLEKKMPTAN